MLEGSIRNRVSQLRRALGNPLKVDTGGGGLDCSLAVAVAAAAHQERLDPGARENCADAFFGATRRYESELIRRGELTVCLGVTSHDRDAE